MARKYENEEIEMMLHLAWAAELARRVSMSPSRFATIAKRVHETLVESLDEWDLEEESRP